MNQNELIQTAKALVAPNKGILAADESTGTIEKRFKSIGLANVEENRRAYRDLLFTTKGFGDFISGVILYDETIKQKSLAGAPFTEVLAKGGHLLLSVGPDAQGRFPTEHADRLRAAGAWVTAHRRLVERARPWSAWGDEHCRYLELDGRLHAVDVSGHGRFGALGRSAGRVTTVVRV